jgi:2-iminobutanoate/2-iminopropanoate deaminase
MIKRHWVAAAPPPPRGVHYHHATQADGWVYVTGQLPSDAADPTAPFQEGIERQATQTFANLTTIVEAVGYTLADAVFARIYLADFDRDYDGFNQVHRRFFSDDNAAPSRTTIGVSRLGRGALVEIDLTLYRAPSP